MALTKEWNRRIQSWMEELERHFYRPLGTIEFSGFTTKEYLDISEVLEKEFKPMPPGTRWGAKWEYGWFKGTIILPKEAEGKRIVLRASVGGESLIYVNGEIAGARDREHPEITLSMSGIPGQKYEIIIESYAGHGPRLENAPPVPPGRVLIPEPGPTQLVVGESSFGIWEEDAYQLWVDVDTLYKLRCNLDENSLRVCEIDKALKEFTLLVDFELPYEQALETFRACREKLKKVLQCVNGSTAPVMYIFGQSHLDLAWLWPVDETIRKCARTLSTQISLMDEYPNYRFLLSQPPIYIMLKEHYPQLYERVKEKIKSGQIIPEGGMWVEADTNIPGGESLIRQLMYGKKFFSEELGITSELLWLPDVFGFSAALPQILKGCGIKYFATQKILRNYYEGDPFPYNVFMWEGIDGSQILTHIYFKNNSPIDPEQLIQRWNQRNQKDDISTFLFPFGYGDGGGGATRSHLEYVNRVKDLEGCPRTKMCHPNEFFKDIEKKGLPQNRYVGELYFQAHRGTYTSQAKTKKGNRKCEFALREAELWSAMARVISDFEYPYDEIEKLWKIVLFNQFHDIIAGTSIRRVHEEAERDYNYVAQEANNIINSALDSIINPDENEHNQEKSAEITVFNSLPWDRKELISLPSNTQNVYSFSDESLPVQLIGDKLFTEVKIPSCGWTTLKIVQDDSMSNSSSIYENEALPIVKATERMLENEYLRIEFNETGEVTSIYDKELDYEFAAGLCNSFRMYKDVTGYYDAWDIDSMYEQLPVELNRKAEIKVLCEGSLAGGIVVERQLNNSIMRQEIILRRASRTVEFRTTIDWREDHKLLKVSFPVNIHANEGIHEIQFGHVKRPNHKSRQYDADRYEVCNHKWTAIMEENRGFAILNDCKYGVNVDGGSINLTLLKSALAPDMYADKGTHEFTYALYCWSGPFIESNVVNKAYEINCPVLVTTGLAGKKSLFKVDKPNIIIETIKLAEDRTGDVIIRLYEAGHATTRCILYTELPVVKAEQTNMLEVVEKELEVIDGKIELEFRAFEIKTLRLKVR